MNLQAIILCGGRGTRLSTLYPDRPKAMVPIAGKPFLQWQLEWLSRGGVRDFHLAAGHLAEALERWAAGQKDFSITVSREPAPLGTGGGLKFIEPFLRSDPFLVLNGDSLLPSLDFQALELFTKNVPRVGKLSEKSSKDWKNSEKSFQGLETFSEKVPTLGKPAGIVVTRIEQAGRYGTVEWDAENRITAFLEKQDRQNGWVNGGVYLLPKALLEAIPANRAVSMETDLFPALARQGLLHALPCPPPLLDMGTPDGIENMEKFLATP